MKKLLYKIKLEKHFPSLSNANNLFVILKEGFSFFFLALFMLQNSKTPNTKETGPPIK